MGHPFPLNYIPHSFRNGHYFIGEAVHRLLQKSQPQQEQTIPDQPEIPGKYSKPVSCQEWPPITYFSNDIRKVLLIFIHL